MRILISRYFSLLMFIALLFLGNSLIAQEKDKTAQDKDKTTVTSSKSPLELEVKMLKDSLENLKKQYETARIEFTKSFDELKEEVGFGSLYKHSNIAIFLAIFGLLFTFYLIYEQRGILGDVDSLKRYKELNGFSNQNENRSSRNVSIVSPTERRKKELFEAEVVEVVNKMLNERDRYRPNNESTVQYTYTQTEKPAEEVKPKIIIKYAVSPEKEGYFEEEKLTPTCEFKSLFEIHIEKDKYTLHLVKDNPPALARAIQSYQQLLTPVCDLQKEPSQNAKRIVEKKFGTLEKDGSILKIAYKLKIDFE